MRNAAEMIELTKSAREPVHRVGWGKGGNLESTRPKVHSSTWGVVWSNEIKSVKVYRQSVDLKLPGGVVM